MQANLHERIRQQLLQAQEKKEQLETTRRNEMILSMLKWEAVRIEKIKNNVKINFIIAKGAIIAGYEKKIIIIFASQRN